MSVEDNIAARKLAEEVCALVVEAWQESELPTSAADAKFWSDVHERVVDLAGIEPPAPVVVEVTPFDSDESRAFGRSEIPFGKHAGQSVDSVPLEYLLWLDMQPDFRVHLRRYLASQRIQSEQP